jgi:hypothetical protein
MRLALDTLKGAPSVRTNSPAESTPNLFEEVFSEPTPSAPESPDSFTLVFRPQETESIIDEDEWIVI